MKQCKTEELLYDGIPVYVVTAVLARSLMVEEVRTVLLTQGKHRRGTGHKGRVEGVKPATWQPHNRSM